MIIELFGPPGSGKTTFANALATRLRESGHVVDLTLSYRPAERPSRSPRFRAGAAENWPSPVAQRLCRPLLEMLAISRHPLLLSHNVGATTRLVRLLAPRSMAVAIRLSQYIVRLLHTWSQASTVRHIVIFDQAFVQVVCSLALFARTADDEVMAHALECSPRPDLLIRLDAPPGILATRLKDRIRGQSPLERLLELDLMTELDSIRIIDQLHDLLKHRGQPVISAISLDDRSLSESVGRVEKQLTAMFSAKQRAMAPLRSSSEINSIPISHGKANY
jgi:thymidylate kinase